MNKHILKLIWNRRKDFVWIFAEQILVFVILFYCLSEVYSKLEKQLNPGNLNVKNVCIVAILRNYGILHSDADNEDFYKKYDYVMNKIKNSPYIEAVHKGYYTVPENRTSSENRKDSLDYKGNKYKFYVKTSDGNFQKVFRVKMPEGTWYKDEAFADGTYPVVLTKSLVEELGLTAPLGVKLNYQGHDFTVTGIMNDYKSFVFDDAMPSAIFANAALKDNERISNSLETAMLIKKGQMSEFANYFWQEATKAFPEKGYQFLIYDLGKSSQDEVFGVYTLVFLTAVIPTLFLTIFAFLGTFSLMYRQSKKSTGEYGLRIALGSTKNGLKSMVLRQSLIIILISALAGSILGLNLYLFLFPEIELPLIGAAWLSTLLLMALFSFVSVWYPAHIAAKTQPAEALKDNP